MGTCKKCNEVVSSVELVEGICKKCRENIPVENVSKTDRHSATKILDLEEKIESFGNGVLKLTDKRIVFDANNFGASGYTSITLDAISSVGLITKSTPLIGILGTFSILIGLLVSSQQGMTLIGIGIVAIIMYFVTRKAVLSIESNGGDTVSVAVKGTHRDKIINFINLVENEKLTVSVQDGIRMINPSQGAVATVIPQKLQELSQRNTQELVVQPEFIEKTIGTIINLHEKVLDAKDETLESVRTENSFLKDALTSLQELYDEDRKTIATLTEQLKLSQTEVEFMRRKYKLMWNKTVEEHADK